MENELKMPTNQQERQEVQSRDLDAERQEIQRLIREQSQSTQAFLAGKFTFN